MTKPLSRWLLAAVVVGMAGAIWPAGAIAGQAAKTPKEELLCEPAPSGDITTFLVAGPLVQPDLALEAAARRRTPTAGNGSTPWRVHVADGRIGGRAGYLFRDRRGLDLSYDAKLRTPIWYAACAIETTSGGNYELSVRAYGEIVVWVSGEGETILSAAADRFSMVGSGRQRIRLPAGRSRVLVRTRGIQGQVGFSLRIAPVDAAPRNAGLTAIVLPTDKKIDRGALFADSLTLISSDSVRRAGDTVLVHLAQLGGRPRLAPAGKPEGKVRVSFSILDPDGKMVAQLQEGRWTPLPGRQNPPASRPGAEPLPVSQLAAFFLKSRWTVTREQLAPPPAGPERTAAGRARAYFRILARVRHTPANGRETELCRKSKLVYRPDGLRVWAREISNQIEKTAARTGQPCPLARLAVEKAALRLEGLNALAGNAEQAADELRQALMYLAREAVGVDPLAGHTGFLERAYVSPVDGSVQPYQLYVPIKPRPAGRRYPVIVFLHGYVPSYHKHEWLPEMPRMNAAAETAGAILVIPFGRSNTDFLTVGEVDVLDVLSDVTRRYPVDADRVALMGYSMGGSGAYTLATHYPDRWSAVMVLAGRCDYYFWHDLAREDVPAWKRFLIDMENPIDQVENLRHLPVRIYHGDADPLVKPGHAYKMDEALRNQGFHVELKMIPGGDHFSGWDILEQHEPYTWLTAQRRPARPREVTLTTYSPKYGRAYWVTIRRFLKEGRRARVQARLDDNARVSISVENVAEFTLSLPGLSPTDIRLEPDEYELRQLRGGVIEGRHRSVKKTPGAVKHRGQTGPIKEAFNRGFLVVYGTGGSVADQGRMKTQAQRFAQEWYRFAKGRPRVISDREVSETDRQSRDLVVFGTPRTCQVLAPLAERLPVTWIDDDAVVKIGPREYSMADRGLMFCYPNPDRPDRLLVVSSGRYHGEHLSINHKLDHLPDLLLYGGPIQGETTNRPIVAAFFGTNWNLRPELMWITP